MSPRVGRELLWAYLARHPFSAVLTAAYLLVALIAASFSRRDSAFWMSLRVGLGSDEPFAHWWSPMTGALVAGSAPELAIAVVGSIVLLGAAEKLMGWRRSAFAFFATAIAGTTAGATLILLGEHGDVSWARSVAGIATVDPQSGIFGAIATASAFAGKLWRRRIRLVAVLVAGVFVLYSGEPADVYRLIATLVGVSLGALLVRTPRPTAWTRSSQHETRLLFASATAVTALGPAITLFSPEHAVAARAFVVPVAPLVILLLAAWALLHGRRFAIWVVAGAELLLAALAAIHIGLAPAFTLAAGTGGDRSVRFEFVATLSIVLPLCLVAALVTRRRSFPATSATGSTTRCAITLAVATAALLTTVVVVNGHAPTAHLVLRIAWTLFWAVVIASTLRPLFGDPSRSPQRDVNRARRLVEFGGDSLAFMSTWPGTDYWFDEDGRAGVAYRLVGRIALTVGGPIGRPLDPAAVVATFAQYCDDNGWVPVFYSVGPELAGVCVRLGWHTQTVAEEAVLDPLTTELRGRKWQKVRSAVNRAEREGMQAVWGDLQRLPRHLARQLAEISEEWVADKELPEMGFTLGSVETAHDPAVRLMVVVDTHGRVQAFTSWLPNYRDGRLVGYTNDVMRRRRDGVHGAMEFCIAAVIARMRADGIRVLSLSAAPLARTIGGEEENLDSLLDALSRRLEPTYGFRGLLEFKKKFQPSMRPLAIAYPDSVALPGIGFALARAYLPTLSLRQASRLLRGLARPSDESNTAPAGELALPAR